MTGVRLHIADGIAELRLDNPAKLNCFTVDMLGQLASHLEVIEGRPEVHAVVVTGEGDRAFCSGADINAWGGLSPAEFARAWVRGGHRLFDRLARLSKPTVAALNGRAFGGGLELAGPPAPGRHAQGTGARWAPERGRAAAGMRLCG